jgi:diguanylate cyclase (GGDEF)-like protein/PAS domain S-box-containing protein
LATFVDITDRKHDEMIILEAERQAAENQAIYRLLLDHSPEMIVLSPFDSSRRYVSSAVQQITGFTAEEYLVMKRFDTVHPEDQEEARRVVRGLRAGHLRHVFRYRTLHKDGTYRWVEAIITGYIDPISGRTGGYVATIRDIEVERQRDERVAADIRQISQEASVDALTEVANRRAFNKAIEAEAKRHTRSTRDLSLMLIDVDYFKRYNDLYGHLAGDDCLRRIAAVLRANVRRDADLVARFGGEEFVILMPMTESDGAGLVAAKILEAVAALGVTHASSPHGVVTVSIGS